MNVNAQRIVSATVLTFQAKTITLIFDIIVRNSRNSRLEQAKIV